MSRLRSGRRWLRTYAAFVVWARCAWSRPSRSPQRESASRIASITGTSGPLRSLGSHIPRRRRIAAHLGNRVPAQPKVPRRLAPALPLDEYKPTTRRIKFHRKHPRLPSESMFGKGRPQKWPGFTPPHSRKMPPLRDLLLLRRVQVRRAPFGDQADADTKSTTSADSLADM
jgi:hypothetical protein